MTTGCLIPFLLINDPGYSKAANITHPQGGTWDASLRREPGLCSDLTGFRAWTFALHQKVCNLFGACFSSICTHLEHSCKLRGYTAVTQRIFVNKVRQKLELLCGVAVSLAYKDSHSHHVGWGETDKKAKVKRPGQRQPSTP